MSKTQENVEKSEGFVHTWAEIRQQAGWQCSLDTCKLSTFNCPFPFIIRGNNKAYSTFAVDAGELLDFLEWGQSDWKIQGQINGVVFG